MLWDSIVASPNSGTTGHGLIVPEGSINTAEEQTNFSGNGNLNFSAAKRPMYATLNHCRSYAFYIGASAFITPYHLSE